MSLTNLTKSAVTFINLVKQTLKSYLLQETGYRLLQENGDGILLETTDGITNLTKTSA